MDGPFRLAGAAGRVKNKCDSFTVDLRGKLCVKRITLCALEILHGEVCDPRRHRFVISRNQQQVLQAGQATR